MQDLPEHPPHATPPSASSPAQSADDQLRSQMGLFRSEMIASVETLAKIGSRSPTGLFLGLGAAIIVTAMFFKLSPAGLRLATLAPTEFISALIVGFLLLLGGALLRLYQFRMEALLSERIQAAGIEVVKGTMRVGADLAKSGTTKRSGL